MKWFTHAGEMRVFAAEYKRENTQIMRILIVINTSRAMI